MPKPEVGPGLIPVKVRYCSICGSDVHIYKDNKIPRALQELVEMLPFHGQGVIVSAYEHTPRIDFNTVMLKSLDL
jgi:NADPH:quinone reductase-like Zn-dependent oxidoreductase